MSEEGDAPAGRRAVTLDERVYAGVEARARATGRTVEEVLDTLLSVLPGARTSPFAASAATAAAADAPAAEARAALLRVSGSGRAASGGGGQRQLDHQGSLLALYITDPIITLVAGLLKGGHTVAQALRHGDFGLGTLDELDGEVVVLDGVPYHQNEHGVRVLAGSEPSPFMTVTWFDRARAETYELAPVADFEGLQEQLRASFRSDNCVYAVHITGKLPRLKVRAVCKQPDGTPLVKAAAKQRVVEMEGEEGDLVGFYCPVYYGPGIQVPGFHLHYISKDRARGGHVLQLSLESGTAQIIEIHRSIVDLPSSDAFMHHDLNLERARSELHAAEQDHS